MAQEITVGSKCVVLLARWLADSENLKENRIIGVVENMTAKAMQFTVTEGPHAGRKLWLALSLMGRGDIRAAVIDTAGALHETTAIKAPTPSPYPYGRIYLEDGDILVAGTPFEYVDRCKSVMGGRWNKKNTTPPTKAWYYNATPTMALSLFTAFVGSKTDLSDAAFLALVEEGKRLDGLGSLKLADESELGQPDGLKHNLWLHQKRALAFASAMPGCGLFMDMGTGKSLTTIAYILQNDIRFTLVVAPKSVVEVWPKEWAKHATEEAIVCALFKGSMEKRAQAAWDAYQEALATGKRLIVVINYESARVFPFGLEQVGGSLKNNGIAFKIPWQLLVVDESHKIKNAQSISAKFCHRIAKQVARRLVLTGTPMPHDPGDVFSQFLVIDIGESFGTAFSRFRTRYAIMGGYGGKQILSWTNLPELEEKMYKRAFRVTEDVVELPEKVFSMRYGTLSAAEARAYREMEDELELALDGRQTAAEVREHIIDIKAGALSDLDEVTAAIADAALSTLDERDYVTASNVLVKLLKLAQITSGFVTTEDKREIEIGHSKLDLLLDTVDDLKRDEPFVIFVRFKHDIAAIKKALTAIGYPVAELSGARNELSAWQRGEYQVLVVQLQSGGVGVDFTTCGDKPCRYCIYYGKDFNWGNYKQSQKRIHRPGQTETTFFITLAMDDTVDIKVEDVLDKRGNLVEAIVNARSLKHAETGVATEQEQDEEAEVAAF